MKRHIVNPVIKDTVTFIQTSAETNGRVTELEVTLMPNGGNALHYHKFFSETFTAIEGKLGLKTGKRQTKILEPSQSFTVEPYQVHNFFNPGKEEIRFRITVTPGNEGFENTLRIGYGLAADGLTDKRSIPKSLSHIALLVAMGDVHMRSALVLLSPMFNWIASRARKRGIEKQLIERYCM